MYKTTLKINGMMCPMCEAHVNDALRKEFQDIKKIKSSHSKNETVLISENEYSKEQFAAVLDKTGYIVEAAECEPYEKKGFSLFNK